MTGDNNEVRVTLVIADQRLSSEWLGQEQSQNPYRGLGAFREQDAQWFFGRSRLARQMWMSFQGMQRRPGHRVLPVVGASGSGKSSLVRAGFLPELARIPLDGMKASKVFLLRPGSNPLHSILEVIQENSENSEIDWSGLSVEMRRNPQILHEFVVAKLCYEKHIIFVIDQFEELFTECSDPCARDAFIENLMYSANAADGVVSVILTLRSDFVGAFREPPLATAIRENRLSIPAMNRDELREAISAPADILGYPWPATIVDNLISQAEGRAGALPLVQFALTRMWPEHTGKRLQASSSTKLIEEFLVQAAEFLFHSTGDSQTKESNQSIIRRAFLAMVQFGEGSADTRRVAALSEFVAANESPDQVRVILESFSSPEARLITASERDGEPAYEITHEVLIYAWDRLQGWLGNTSDLASRNVIRSELRLHRRLSQAATDWKCGAAGLWRPPELDLALRYAAKAAVQLTSSENDFVVESDRVWTHAKTLERERIAAIQHLQSRTRRFQQLTGIALALIAVGVLSAGYLVWSEWRDVMFQKSQVLASLSQEQVRRGDAVTAQLLALEGLKDPAAERWSQRLRPWVVRAYYALKHAMYIKREMALYYPGANDAVDVATFSLDGERVLMSFGGSVTTGSESTVRAWDAGDGKEIHYPNDSADREEQDKLLGTSQSRSPNKKFAIRAKRTSFGGYSLELHSITENVVSARLPEIKTGGPETAISDSGSQVAIWGFGGDLTFWNPSDGSVRAASAEELSDLSSILAVGFAGRFSVVAHDDGLSIWDPDTAKRLNYIKVGKLEYSKRPFAISSDQSRLIVPNGSGSLLVFETQTWSQVDIKSLNNRSAAALSFSPDDKTVAIIFPVTRERPLQSEAELWSFPEWKRQINVGLGEEGAEYIEVSGKGARFIVKNRGGITLWDTREIAKEEAVRTSTLSSDPDGNLDVVFGLIDGVAPYDLIQAAKNSTPRCLTPRQRDHFDLDNEPPRWCVLKQKWPMPLYSDTRIESLN